LVFLRAREVATTIGPRRPNSITSESKNLAWSGRSGVIPVERPTVPIEEIISKSNWSVVKLVVNLRMKSAPIITAE
jgi:hypothetical protein